jgi:hypothetical protein
MYAGIQRNQNNFRAPSISRSLRNGWETTNSNRRSLPEGGARIAQGEAQRNPEEAFSAKICPPWRGGSAFCHRKRNWQGEFSEQRRYMPRTLSWNCRMV